jgi:hypothetical protein
MPNTACPKWDRGVIIPVLAWFIAAGISKRAGIFLPNVLDFVVLGCGRIAKDLCNLSFVSHKSSYF